MKLHELVDCSQAVRGTRSRKAKTGHLAELLARATDGEIATVVAWLAGELRQGKIGLGYSSVFKARDQTPPATSPTLTVAGLDAALTHIGALSGKGSGTARGRELASLMAASTDEEQRFLSGLITGELRQGALAGVMTEAIAVATDTPPASVRRAAMLSGDLAHVAEVARTQGSSGLDAFRVELFRPLQPMLAKTADSVDEALSSLGGTAALEYKIDGARIQVHKDGERVRVFTRGLKEVTGAVPEVVSLAHALPVPRVILDGEVIAFRPDGLPHTFQTTMRRFGRKLQARVASLQDELPLTPVFFDCLLLGDEELLDAPGHERLARLVELTPEANVVPHLRTNDVAAAAAFLDRALDAGHEGVMAKNPDARWEAGSRGAGWLKLKPAWTLDLVVLAAEWGSGRRKGKLSNLHLGARDPETGGFVMLGKTFKGLTDATLAWQTEQLLAREERRSKYAVHVRPELVVEIAFNEIQTSPRYASGLALRFARVKSYRPDKQAHEADTIDTVRRIHAGDLRLVDLVRGRA